MYRTIKGRRVLSLNFDLLGGRMMVYEYVGLGLTSAPARLVNIRDSVV